MDDLNEMMGNMNLQGGIPGGNPGNILPDQLGQNFYDGAGDSFKPLFDAYLQNEPNQNLIQNQRNPNMNLGMGGMSMGVSNNKNLPLGNPKSTNQPKNFFNPQNAFPMGGNEWDSGDIAGFDNMMNFNLPQQNKNMGGMPQQQQSPGLNLGNMMAYHQQSQQQDKKQKKVPKKQNNRNVGMNMNMNMGMGGMNMGMGGMNMGMGQNNLGMGMNMNNIGGMDFNNQNSNLKNNSNQFLQGMGQKKGNKPNNNNNNPNNMMNFGLMNDNLNLMNLGL